jgi:hypothetical protein
MDSEWGVFVGADIHTDYVHAEPTVPTIHSLNATKGSHAARNSAAPV